MFAPHNLLRDPPFSRLDLDRCRNLLIYLDREVAGAACSRCSISRCGPAASCSSARRRSVDEAADTFVVVDKREPALSRAACACGAVMPLRVDAAGGRRMPIRRRLASPVRRTMPTPRFTSACSRAMRRRRSSSTTSMRSSTCPTSAGQFLRFTGRRAVARPASTPCTRRCASSSRPRCHQAFQTMKRVEARHVELKRPTGDVVRRNHGAAGAATCRRRATFALVIFDEVDAAAGGRRAPPTSDPAGREASPSSRASSRARASSCARRSSSTRRRTRS